MINESRHFPELFGSMVFNEETMKERLSPSCYNQWKQSVSDGTPLEISTANEIGPRVHSALLKVFMCLRLRHAKLRHD